MVAYQAKAQYLGERDCTEPLDEGEKIVLLHVAQHEAIQGDPRNDLRCELLALRSAEHFFVSCRLSEELLAHSAALLYWTTKSS